MKNTMNKKANKKMNDGVVLNGKQIVLGLFSLIIGSASLLTPVHAQNADYNWVLTKSTAASGAGSKLAILIPNTNSPLGRLDCVDNQGKGTYTVFTLAANVGKTKSSTPAKVTITTAQGKHDFSGLIVEPATGGGIKGVTFSIANGHAVWPEIVAAKHFDYQVQGFIGSRLNLTAAKGKISQFTQACGFTTKIARTNVVIPQKAPTINLPPVTPPVTPPVAVAPIIVQQPADIDIKYRAIAVYFGKLRGKRNIQFRYGFSGLKNSPASAEKSAIEYCKRYARKRRGSARCKVAAVVGTGEACKSVSTTYRGKRTLRGNLCLDGFKQIRKASSKKKSRKSKGRCRPRSVYVAGRGCILKRYVK